MTNFQSAQRRTFWIGIAYTLLTDYLVAVAVCAAFGLGSASWGFGLFWTVAAQLFLALHGLLSFARRLAWYYLFEKETRVAAIVADFRRLKFPAPERFYNDVDEYLTKAATSKHVSKDGRLTAGITLGAMYSQRHLGPRAEAMVSAMAIEEAIRRLPPAPDTDEDDQDGTSAPDFDFKFDTGPEARQMKKAGPETGL